MDHLKNPFLPHSTAKPDFAALGDIFLSLADAAKLRELESAPGPSTQDHVPDELSLEEGLTAEERRRMEEHRFENDPKYSRERFIKWAKIHRLGNEGWVDFYFDFDDDGFAICRRSLDLGYKGITYFPKGIKEIHGDLNLSHNQISKIENLPAILRGSLNLSHNQITKIENLPATVDGDLNLSNNAIIKIENLPDVIGRSLSLNNNHITKIENLPDTINENLTLHSNEIEVIENLPETIGGYLYLGGNPAKKMQRGVIIRGTLHLSYDQHDLIKDAKAKGYYFMLYKN